MLRKGPPKPRSRITAALLALFMLFGTTTAIVTVTSAGVAKASVGTNDYPWSGAADCHTTYGIYSWCLSNYDLSALGFGYRNCTDYAAYELNEQLGGTVPNPKFTYTAYGFSNGNAAGWKSAITAKLGSQAANGTPATGSVAWWGTEVGSGFGHVAIVTGVNYNSDGSVNSITTADYNSGDPIVNGSYTWGNYATHTLSPSSGWPDSFLHVADTASGSGRTTYPDGTFLQATDDNGKLYEIIGGAPMYVTSTSSVPWTGIFTKVTAAYIASLPMYPADNTVFQPYRSGNLYVVGGGHPYYLDTTQNIPYDVSSSYLSHEQIDPWDITNVLRSQPPDDAHIRDWLTGKVYVISGGAAMYANNDTSVPNYYSFVNVDTDAVNSLRQYPADGSVVVDSSPGSTNGYVYQIVGGAPMYVHDIKSGIPKPTSMAFVSDWSLHNQLLGYPMNGTVIQNYSNGYLYVIAGGCPLYITGSTGFPIGGFIQVDGYSIPSLPTYPGDGTFVVGYQSHRVYEIQNQKAVYIGDSSLITSTPVTVDDWAIINQLGATEQGNN